MQTTIELHETIENQQFPSTFFVYIYRETTKVRGEENCTSNKQVVAVTIENIENDPNRIMMTEMYNMRTGNKMNKLKANKIEVEVLEYHAKQMSNLKTNVMKKVEKKVEKKVATDKIRLNLIDESELLTKKADAVADTIERINSSDETAAKKKTAIARLQKKFTSYTTQNETILRKISDIAKASKKPAKVVPAKSNEPIDVAVEQAIKEGDKAEAEAMKEKDPKKVAKAAAKKTATNKATAKVVAKAAKSTTPKTAKAPTAPKAKKVSKTAVIVAALDAMIKKGKSTKAELFAAGCKACPEATESTVRTLITDGKNPKYNKFPSLLIEGEGKVISYKK